MFIHRVINNVFTSNTYILIDESKSAFLIDIGDIQPVRESLDKEEITVKAVFLTHTHYDHIYGIRELMKAYPNCTIFTSSFGAEALSSDKLNFSRYHNDPIIWKGDNLSVLSEGDRVAITSENSLEVLETPGHDKSCLTYKLGNDIFSGDSYIPGIKVIASFPNSNKVDAQKSKERIIKLSEGCNLFPGHGDAYIHYSKLSHEQVIGDEYRRD